MENILSSILIERIGFNKNEGLKHTMNNNAFNLKVLIFNES